MCTQLKRSSFLEVHIRKFSGTMIELCPWLKWVSITAKMHDCLKNTVANTCCNRVFS